MGRLEVVVLRQLCSCCSAPVVLTASTDATALAGGVADRPAATVPPEGLHAAAAHEAASAAQTQVLVSVKLAGSPQGLRHAC